MKLTSILSTAVLAATTLARDVDCLVDGVSVATVDLDTGVCPFAIPASDPVLFDFVSFDDFDVTTYYTVIGDTKFFADIRDAGRIIDIPASLIFEVEFATLFQIHAEKTPSANSTAAIRRRLLKSSQVTKRDEVDDFVAFIESLQGTALPGTSFAVVDAAASSSAGGAGASVTSAPEGTQTTTEQLTTVITITSCSDNKCSETAVSAVETLTTVTVNGEVTSYTTYCPLSDIATETDISTTVVTITSCENNACHETVLPAVETVTTVTVNGEVTSYTTVCPLTEYESTSTELVTSYLTVTSCGPNGCEEKSVYQKVTTETVNGVETIYTTYCPVEASQTTEAPQVSNAPNNNNVNEVSTECTSDECEITTTIESTVIVAPSSKASHEEATISTYSAAAPVAQIGGITSLVAMVFGYVLLL